MYDSNYEPRSEAAAARNGDGGSLRDELLWQAFQYASDELSEAEALAFEQRLGADQSAREALAQAIALGDVVRAAERPVGVDCGVMPATVVAAAMGSASLSSTDENRASSFHWSHTAGWMALGAAVCLALTFVLTPKRVTEEDRPTTAAVPNASISDQQLLAVLWPDDVSAEHTANADSSSDLNATTLVDDEPADDLFEVGVESLTMSDAAMAPDWLIAAVAESSSVSSDNE